MILSRLSDFVRIVNPSPTDEFVTQRRAAIDAFAQHFQDGEVLYATVDLAAFGVASNTSSASKHVAQKLVSAIQEQQPSYGTDIAQNAVDLHVCAVIALAAHLENKNNRDYPAALAAAALVISALAARPPMVEGLLAELLQILVDIAGNRLNAASLNARERLSLPDLSVQGADPASIVKSANTTLDTLKNVLTHNSKADREELQILWWVFAGHSTVLDKPLPQLDAGSRALAAAGELADIMLLPPSPNVAQFLHAALKEDAMLTIRQLVHACPAPLFESLLTRHEKVETILKNHSPLLPLTWLFARRLDSGMSPGWEAEFQHKTYIQANEERFATQWALQVLNEGSAQRLLIEPLDDLC